LKKLIVGHLSHSDAIARGIIKNNAIDLIGVGLCVQQVLPFEPDLELLLEESNNNARLQWLSIRPKASVQDENILETAWVCCGAGRPVQRGCRRYCQPGFAIHYQKHDYQPDA
jgi:hypothetical protein